MARGSVTHPVRAVLFDAGNTLVYLDWGRMAEIFRRAGADADEAKVREAELEARRALQQVVSEGHVGTEPAVWRHYFDTLFRCVGVPAGAVERAGAALREVHGQDHLWTGVENGTAEALEALAAEGLRLAVISNADGRMEGVLERVGLRPHFEFVLDSEVVGVEKPDPSIFRAASDRLGLEPSSCLYVGDLYPVDYLGATGAGMKAVLLDPLGVHDPGVPVVSALRELPAFVAGLPWV